MMLSTLSHGVSLCIMVVAPGRTYRVRVKMIKCEFSHEHTHTAPIYHSAKMPTIAFCTWDGIVYYTDGTTYYTDIRTEGMAWYIY